MNRRLSFGDAMRKMHKKFDLRLIIPVALLLLLHPIIAANRYIYHDYTEMTNYLQKLSRDHSKLVILKSQGETLGKRQLWSLTISSGEPDEKPALLILGGVEGSDLISSELCLHFIHTLVTHYDKVDSITQLLKNTTFYIFPRINPDASEAFFKSPTYERMVNNRSTDLDKDGSFDEDGYDDLNGDGLISLMRITDPAGEWMADSEIPQLLIKADRSRGQKGIYRIYTEGVDNDKDGQWNEDEPGGVNFNRNFSYNYKFFTVGAGSYPMSAIESNCIAQFAFSHSNIAAIFCFSRNENLHHPWQAQKDEKTDAYTRPEKPLTGVRPKDAPYFDQVAEQFKKMTAFSDAPESPEGEGAFSEWGYYHYGRWSFSIPGWWPPIVKESADTTKIDTIIQQKEVKLPDAGKPNKPDPIDRERRLWKWLTDTKQIDAFVPWREVAHPDFPDEIVEVGGFPPYIGINPPVDSIKVRSRKYSDFLLHLASLLPRITISKTKVEALHENMFRLQVFITNNGFLPTNTDLGVHSKWNPKVKISIDLDKGQQLLDYKGIVLIDTIAGSGSTIEKSWIIMGKRGSRITIKAESPMAGSDVKIAILE
jgi:hypothetical protein